MKKWKGSVKVLNADMLLILFGLFTAAAVGIRSYQLMYIFEPDTGFYLLTATDNFTIPLLYTVVAASCALFLILSFLCGGLPKEKAPVGKNYYMASSSAIFAVTLVLSGMQRFSDLFSRFDASEYSALSEFLLKSKSVPQVFEILFALLAALYFVIVAVSYFSGSQAFASARVMSLMPVCWLMCRLITRFVRTVSFIHVSELFWELMMIIALMVFFMEFARIMSGIGQQGKLSAALGTGLCGAMLAFMISLSRIITWLFAGDAYLSADSPVEFCDFGAALLVCVFLLSCVHNLRAKSDMAPAASQPVPAAVKPASPEEKTDDEEVFRIAEQYANRYITEEPYEMPSVPASVPAEDSAASEPAVPAPDTAVQPETAEAATEPEESPAAEMPETADDAEPADEAAEEPADENAPETAQAPGQAVSAGE